MSYWDETDRIIREGRQPSCVYFGNEMIPEDDHGRFTCFCDGYTKANHPRYSFPQVREELPDEEKSKIHPLNRLYLKPTQEEQKFFDKCLEDIRTQMKKPDGTDSK